MTTPTLNDLIAFAAIVEHRSFRKASDDLNLSPSTLSHMMRALEKNLGTRLLHRTTRSVAPTEAGERLVSRLLPLMQDFALAIDEARAFSGSPHGTLRINASETAARLLLREVVPTFLAQYPEMAVDLVTEGKLVDIVAGRFDAGVRLGEAVPQDMIAIPFGGEVRFIAVASPGYLAQFPPPKTPDDLKYHRCIRVRMPSGKMYRWEFEKHGLELHVEVSGPVILDHLGMMAEAACDGLGIAYVPERTAKPYLESGQLLEVLPDWCPASPGLFLYYSGRRYVPSGLRAFIEVMKKRLP